MSCVHCSARTKVGDRETIGFFAASFGLRDSALKALTNMLLPREQQVA